ncbi:gamma-glutamylcyclotransferase [Paenibacillus sp. KS-LC4]|uniref:gamma-glutamylcyclotransferase family protein n=1 Tax=Paenibacillus sp. KS-LC4 TaxID=2979727 RepID=UPI0030D59398
MPRLFVYGTLRKGGNNHHYMNGALLLSLHTVVKGTLVDSGKGFPGMLLEDGMVFGELYDVSEETLARIDKLEEYFGPDVSTNLYNRVEVDVRTEQATMSAWTYIYNCEDYFHPRFSDWMQYNERRERFS